MHLLQPENCVQTIGTQFFWGLQTWKKPPVLPGEKKGFSKGKTGELKASPKNLAKR